MDGTQRFIALAITKERLPNARISLEIEVDPERVEKHKIGRAHV